ncbi:MAG: hypothetical protein IPN33_22350 [Saprospiraceae bacterium]|nr:hypothetical protein [Saprospiraceae bacterium]
MKKLIAFLIIAACWGLNTPSFAQTQLGGDMDGEAPLDRLGSAVALSADGNRLAAGAPGNDANGDKAGHVRVYELLNSAWIQMGEDIDGGTAFDGAGSSVDLSADGNRLAVGLPGHNAVLSGIGQVRIYEWLDGGWSQLGQAIDGQITNEIAGTSVSLSADGMKVAIGAPYKFDAGNGHPSGKVRIYKWFQGVWTQVGEDIIGSVLSDEFGVSVPAFSRRQQSRHRRFIWFFSNH